MTYKYFVPSNADTPVIAESFTAPTDDDVTGVHGERLPISKPPFNNGERAQTEELALREAVVLVVNPDLVMNAGMVETVMDDWIVLEEWVAREEYTTFGRTLEMEVAVAAAGGRQEHAAEIVTGESWHCDK